MSQHVQYGTTGLVVFVALTAADIISVTMLIWLAANGSSVLAVFPFCVGAWGCYMCSHYLVDGQLLDESSREGNSEAGFGPDSMGRLSDHLDRLPSSPTRWALAIGGVGSMLLTFPTGIVAVGSNDFTLLLVSATLFVGGYIVGHQGITGKPL